MGGGGESCVTTLTDKVNIKISTICLFLLFMSKIYMCLICGRYLQYGQLGNSFSLRAGLHSPMQTFWGMSNLTGSWAQLFGPVGIRNAAPHSSLQVGSLPFHMYFCFFA